MKASETILNSLSTLFTKDRHYDARIRSHWLLVTEHDDAKWLMHRNDVRFVFVLLKGLFVLEFD